MAVITRIWNPRLTCHGCGRPPPTVVETNTNRKEALCMKSVFGTSGRMDSAFISWALFARGASCPFLSLIFQLLVARSQVQDVRPPPDWDRSPPATNDGVVAVVGFSQLHQGWNRKLIALDNAARPMDTPHGVHNITITDTDSDYKMRSRRGLVCRTSAQIEESLTDLTVNYKQVGTCLLGTQKTQRGRLLQETKDDKQTR
ncbi:hypothetical protein EDD16DRAFT_1244894 [Pisolithus croceorrhizus]|nr:hypothetical protein EDD16DRAFT_1244894 [Pisolithus croceorrhizus]KAI6133553.1 hypothetical protein EV401DRAFT_99784 [Pisolithus croceorrhizus]